MDELTAGLVDDAAVHGTQPVSGPRVKGPRLSPLLQPGPLGSPAQRAIDDYPPGVAHVSEDTGTPKAPNRHRTDSNPFRFTPAACGIASALTVRRFGPTTSSISPGSCFDRGRPLYRHRPSAHPPVSNFQSIAHLLPVNIQLRKALS